ncbi:transcriptional repressor [Nesterenkonia pannonica]|uniref:Fur family transcriptional regulator n=1 Tax=Nesterenkonia pannonica TaxID=1548602 RepID=UPI0021645DAF|nr:transcriptional repressor [Nesterenkonia pannonica]
MSGRAHHRHHHGQTEELVETALQTLREHGERATSARQAVLQTLATHHRHLSADEVAEELSSHSIHRTTVYRALERFAELGIVAVRQVAGKPHPSTWRPPPMCTATAAAARPWWRCPGELRRGRRGARGGRGVPAGSAPVHHHGPLRALPLSWTASRSVPSPTPSGDRPNGCRRALPSAPRPAVRSTARARTPSVRCWTFAANRLLNGLDAAAFQHRTGPLSR